MSGHGPEGKGSTTGSSSLRAVALRYYDLGWHPLPLPANAKAPPPDGRTGYGGVDLTRAEIEVIDWSGNIALRMSGDVIGLDVDAYRGGDVTLRELLGRCGPLPDTWISHSGRNDGSGIRFFRVPRLSWVHALAGIEIIQAGHRYAVAYPSTHPDGRQYGWFDQAEGGRAEGLPVVEDLPELGWAWIAELSRAEVSDVRSYAVDRSGVGAFVEAHVVEAQPSYINTILDHFVDQVNAGHSRHDGMVHALLWALEHVRAGVAAAAPTLDALASLWTQAVAGDARRAELTSPRRTTEWEAMVRHAVGRVNAKTPDEIRVIHDEAVGPVMNVAQGGPEPPPSTSTPEEREQPPESEGDDDKLPRPIDWKDFAGRDEEERSWLVEGFWPWGRAMALWAAAKTGKSELALWCAAKLALGEHPWTGASIEPVDVAYFDFEMTADDLDDRLAAFDIEPIRLNRLHYFLLPALHALDVEAGGTEVEALALRHGVAAVVFDTFGRSVAGDENSADTVRAFYRFTGSRLKRLGIGYLRTDHAGKDVSKGQRGSSAKRDDVDVIWSMTRPKSGGVKLDCTGSSRLSWVGPTLKVERLEVDGVLSYTAPVQIGWPAGTAEKVAQLDALGLPLDVSRRDARAALKATGVKPGTNEILGEALRFRVKRGGPSERTTGSPQGLESGPDPNRTSIPSSSLTCSNAVGPLVRTSSDQSPSPGLVPLRSIGADHRTTDDLKADGQVELSEPALRASGADEREAIETSPDAEAERKAAELEETWRRNEEIGRETGHVVTRCPGCGARAMTSIVNSSGTSRWTKSGGGWPKCKQCLEAPRVEPLGDVALVRRLAPGQNPTARQLARRPAGDGFDWRPRKSTPPDPEASTGTPESEEGMTT